MVRSYRYRIYPTVHQAAALNVQFATCCDIYNAALEQRIRAHRECGVSVSLNNQHAELTQVRAVRGLLPEGMSTWVQRSALEREANRRRDFAHKLSRRLVDDFDLIAFEALNVAGMTRGNRGLSREILDQGWSLLLQLTTYKAEDAGRCVVLVNPAYTSQTCNACGLIAKASRHGTVFRCASCGHEDHADINAAKNILRAGLALRALTAGEESIPSPEKGTKEPPVTVGKRAPTEGKAPDA